MTGRKETITKRTISAMVGKGSVNHNSRAFVAKNEVAYVCGTDKVHFSQFAQSLVSSMLAKHESISFESDDCDWAAMMLKCLFINQDETSFDTYVMGEIV